MASKAKSELRRLMQVKKGGKKVDHPLAKYNGLGNLSCIICNVPVKSELTWPAHLQSRRHKEAIVDLKANKNTQKVQLPKANHTVQNKKKNEPSTANVSQGSFTGLPTDFFDLPRKTEEVRNKRSNVNNEDKNDQKKKSRIDDVMTSSSLKTCLKNSSKGELASKQTNTIKTSALPTDFFDTALPKTSNSEDEIASKSKDSDKKQNEASEAIPKGFFDDAKQDAKARHVEYKDPKEEEWEKFQKIIQVESKVAESLKEEEEEESERVKDLTELGKFSQCLTRVDKLMERHKNIKPTKIIHKQSENDNETSSKDSDDELEDLFNWRAKKA